MTEIEKLEKIKINAESHRLLLQLMDENPELKKIILNSETIDDVTRPIKKWAEANPGYWKGYRKKNPEKAVRNRILQTIRNRRRFKNQDLNAKVDASLIAKVDASKSSNFKVVGQFWLVLVIAKVDALKVNIHEISTPYH